MTIEVLKSSISNEEKEDFIYTKLGDNLEDLLTNLQSTWPDLTSQRQNKIIKKSFSLIAKTAENTQILENVINWAKENERSNLILELELILSEFYLQNKMFSDSLELIKSLEKTYKDLDDKVKMAELFLLESRVLYEVESFDKAKTALSMAKNLSLSVLCGDHTQSMIDMMNGIYLCDDGDYNSATSYFLESYNGFHGKNAENILCYVILCRIFLKKFSLIDGILSIKRFLPFKDSERVRSMVEIKNCVQSVDIKGFSAIIQKDAELCSNAFLKKHLFLMYQILLDKNIIKIIKPYSVIKIKFIANALKFEESEMEKKLRIMILEGKINGNIDHESGVFVFKGKVPKDPIFEGICKELEKNISELSENVRMN